MREGRADELERLVASMLETAKVQAVEVSLRFDVDDVEIVVSVADAKVAFRSHDVDWELEWELLSRLLVREVTSARLRRLARERGENRPGLWSVFSSAFTLDWLAWNAGGIGTSSWEADTEQILQAADRDGAIGLPSRQNPRLKGLKGNLRDRTLFAHIDLGDAEYDGRCGQIRARAIIPNTTATLSGTCSLTDYIGHPAINGRQYGLLGVSTSDDGTVFRLDEQWLALAPYRAGSPRQELQRPTWALSAKASQRLSQIIIKGASLLAGHKTRSAKISRR